MSVTADALGAALEAALLRELRTSYEYENRVRFAGKLTPPVIVLSDAATRLGRWDRGSRRLELSRTLVLVRPWPEVQSVLEHEMAHQYVDEVLQVRDESAHGETFQRVCKERGIDARAAGAPVPAPDAAVDKILERIRKLLALADSPNQHEAELAMQKAHELMLRHNVEQVRIKAEDRSYEVRHVGDPARRTNRVESDIVGLLSELFFVRVIRIPVYLPRTGKHGGVYELVGTAANVDMAVHVYEFLLGTCERLWRENRRDARVRGGRDRLAYQSGVVKGFRDKLVSERVVLRGTGLVWVGDRKLDDFYHARHPRIATRRRSVRVGRAHDAGREAGRTVVLHRPVTQSSSGTVRLLR